MIQPFKNCLLISALLCFSLLNQPRPVFAGFLDKLNEASEKMKQASNNLNSQSQNWQGYQAPSPIDSDRPLNLDGYKGHCNGQGGATCLDYMDKVDGCMAPLKGYRSKLTGDLIERKLSNDTTLSPELRKNLQEDLVAARTAQQQGSDTIISTPGNPQRYLQDISMEDQQEINAQFAPFYQKIMNKCMGADHMGVGHRTEMNYIQDNSADMAEQQRRDQAFKSSMDCLKKSSGLRWKIMADKMEAKMNAQPNLTAKEKQEWQEDIALLRQTYETGGTTMPVSPDPKQPTRYMMRLISNEEQMAVNQEFMAASAQMRAECEAMGGAGQPIQSGPLKSGGLVDRSQSPAAAMYQRVNTQPSTYVREVIDPNYVPLFKSGVTPAAIPAGHPQLTPQITEEEMLNTHSKIASGGSLSASLGATDVSYMKTFSRCADPIKGLRARLIAQVLQYKHDTTTNLSPSDRVKYEADIRAAWEASAKGLDTVPSPDPSAPNRPFEWLNSVDQQDLNQEYSRMVQQIMQRCNGKASTMTAFN